MSLLLDALKQAELAKAQQSGRAAETDRREPRADRSGSALDVDTSMEPMPHRSDRTDRGHDAPSVLPLPEALEVPRIKAESRLAAERSALPGDHEDRVKRRNAAQESAAALFDVKTRGDRTSERSRFIMLAALGVAALTAGGLYLRDLLDIESGARPFRPGTLLPTGPGGSRPDRPAEFAKAATNSVAPTNDPGQTASPPASTATAAPGPATAMAPAGATVPAPAAPAPVVAAPLAPAPSSPPPPGSGAPANPAAAGTPALAEGPAGSALSANFADAGRRPIEAGTDGPKPAPVADPLARSTPAKPARPQTKTVRPGTPPARGNAQSTQPIPRAPLRIAQAGPPGGTGALPQSIPAGGGDGSIHLTPAKRPATAFEPTVQRAYASLLSGDFASARNAYREVAANDPANLDAELGLATVAASTGDSAIALRHYRRALEIAPGNPTAIAGLAALRGSTGIAGDEATLRDQVEQRPDPALYFALGNEYSAQSRWSEAQQSYFDAFRLDSGNPDYAYNLAVSLDHLGKTGPARSYYEQARVLAAKRRANFDAAAIAARLAELH